LLHDNDDDAAAGPGELLGDDYTAPQPPLMAKPTENIDEQTETVPPPTGASPALPQAPIAPA